jgi:inorganic phosphate transporter, PiT family
MPLTKATLDKDLDKIVHVEAATRTVATGLVGHMMALLFLGLTAVLAGVYAGVSHNAGIWR